MIGRVVSTKSKNTAAVLVERTSIHPLYRKTFIRTKKYLVGDEIGVKEGDIVEIVKIKPISKRKHWKIVKVLGKRLVEIAEAQMKEKVEEVIAEVMPEEKEEDGVQGIGSSEETKKNVEKKKTERKTRKEKLAPKP